MVYYLFLKMRVTDLLLSKTGEKIKKINKPDISDKSFRSNEIRF